MKSIISIALLTVIFMSCKKTASDANHSNKNNSDSGVAPSNFFTDKDFQLADEEKAKIEDYQLPMELLGLSFRIGPLLVIADNEEAPVSDEVTSKSGLCSIELSGKSEKLIFSMKGSEFSYFSDVDDTSCSKLDDDESRKTTKHLEKNLMRFACEGSSFSKESLIRVKNASPLACKTKGHYLAQWQIYSAGTYSNPAIGRNEKVSITNTITSTSTPSGEPCPFAVEGNLWVLTNDCMIRDLNKSEYSNSLLKVVHSKGSKFSPSTGSLYFSSGSSTFEINGIKGTLTYSGATIAPKYSLTIEGKVLTGTIPTDSEQVLKEYNEALNKRIGVSDPEDATPTVMDDESLSLRKSQTKSGIKLRSRPNLIHRISNFK